MADELRFLNTLAAERVYQILRTLPDTDGHGATLTKAIKGALGERLTNADAILTGLPYTPTEERVKIRELQRLIQETDTLYSVVSTFLHDVGRSDLPMGLLYLVDELINDLLSAGADPIVHVDQRNMYSTWSVFHAIPSILDPATHPEPHPVAFNVPGLDPANALFAPILAHEVGHTCWQRGMGTQLQAMLDVPAIEAQLQIATKAGVPANVVMDRFSSWLQELMCDALAATLTGPSFLFASAAFLPAPGQAVLGSHPYPRDRIAFTLRILERHSWTPILAELVQETLSWCQELAEDPQLTGDPLETALRGAAKCAEEAMMELAENIAINRVKSDQLKCVKEEVFAHLDLNVPPAIAAGNPLSAWLLISAVWIHEIRRRASEGPSVLPSIAVDVRLNRFLIKSVELAGIVRLWRSDGSAAT